MTRCRRYKSIKISSLERYYYYQSPGISFFPCGQTLAGWDDLPAHIGGPESYLTCELPDAKRRIQLNSPMFIAKPPMSELKLILYPMAMSNEGKTIIYQVSGRFYHYPNYRTRIKLKESCIILGFILHTQVHISNLI